MRFSQPLWLVAAAVIPIYLWIHKRGLGVVAHRQRMAGLVVRITLIVALVLALAGTSVSLPDPTFATVFVLDRSDSVSGSGLEEAESFVRNALERKRSDDLAGVVVGGREARVELGVQRDPELTRVASQPDASRTDLARGLRLAAAVLPEGTRRRIVLLTDGRENSGDLRAEARRLQRLGIRLDTVSLESSLGIDAAVLALDAPARARVGDEIELTVKVQADANMRGATVKVSQGSGVLFEKVVDLAQGENRFSILTVAKEVGAFTFTAQVHHDRDSVPQNDSSSALTIVSGSPRVVVIEAEPGEGSPLVQALLDRGISVEVRTPSSFPSPAELASVDSIVLVDVDASALTSVQQSLLKGFVQDLGHGLVAVGGESSWSLGGYENSILEELLPVSSEIRDPERRPSIAQILVIDSSGSMAMGGDSTSKIEIGKSGALLASRALRDQDELGILAFNTSSLWVLELQKLPNEEKIRSALGRLQANGGTDIPQAIDNAVRGIERSGAALKHIILFSDGFNGSGDMLAAAKNVRDKGATLSVIGTGESAADVLESIAKQGGGRFYPGRDLSQIPKILHDETLIASRRYVNEGVFHPKISGLSAATEGLKESPSILGYIGTSPKPSASVSLSIGEFDDPLLATWRTGLGVATAWTSDAKARWSSNWIGWEGFADFWSRVVRETLPASPAPGFSTKTTATDNGIEIVVESELVMPEGTNGVARVIDPQGRAHSVELVRSGLNQMTGTGFFGNPGAYLVSVQLGTDEERLYADSVGAIRTYSPEYRPLRPNPSLLKEAARAAGGRFEIKPVDAFRRDIPMGRRHVDVSRWLLLTALLLLPFDIALRRLSISKEDIRLARAARREREMQHPEATERLLRAKRRAVFRHARPHEARVPPPVVPDREMTLPVAEAREEPADEPADRPADEPAQSQQDSTASELLRRKRQRWRPR